MASSPRKRARGKLFIRKGGDKIMGKMRRCILWKMSARVMRSPSQRRLRSLQEIHKKNIFVWSINCSSQWFQVLHVRRHQPRRWGNDLQMRQNDAADRQYGERRGFLQTAPEKSRDNPVLPHRRKCCAQDRRMQVYNRELPTKTRFRLKFLRAQGDMGERPCNPAKQWGLRSQLCIFLKNYCGKKKCVDKGKICRRKLESLWSSYHIGLIL